MKAKHHLKHLLHAYGKALADMYFESDCSAMHKDGVRRRDAGIKEMREYIENGNPNHVDRLYRKYPELSNLFDAMLNGTW